LTVGEALYLIDEKASLISDSINSIRTNQNYLKTICKLMKQAFVNPLQSPNYFNLFSQKVDTVLSVIFAS